MKSPCFVILSLLGVGALAACAKGTDVDPAASFLASAPVEAGTAEDEDETIKVPAPSNPPADGDGSTADDDAGGGGGGSTDGGSDAGPDSGPEPDGGGGGDGGAGSCASPNTCSIATNLGSVSGDTGADVKSAEGYTSEWFTVRVSEDESGVAGVPLWMTATLVSPPGTNYDLYVYVPASDTLECSAVSYASTSTGSVDTTKASFGEALLSNGSSDDRTVTVEVRHVSGTCEPTKKWRLDIEGNK